MDDGGLEKLSGRSLACAVAARVVGTALFEAGSALRELSKAAWMVESHFGRRYDAITDVDLSESVGEPGYFYGGWRQTEDDEEEVEVEEDEDE
jgi:hypothetical protein